MMNDVSGQSGHESSISSSSFENSAAQKNIDFLFDRSRDKSEWEPAQPPEVLGELLDSRYMLPLFFPSDPRMLSALPGNIPEREREKRGSVQFTLTADNRSASSASFGNRGTMAWKSRSKGLRQVQLDILQWVDGVRAVGRWSRQPEIEDEDEDEDGHAIRSDDSSIDGVMRSPSPHLTPLRRKASTRSRTGRASTIEEATSPTE